MQASFKRIHLESCWASARITVLDSHERYEDSYAITQEFREWITCPADHPKYLESSLLMVPNSFTSQLSEEGRDIDEMLEI